MKGVETKHLLAFKQAHLKPGEQIEIFLDGWIGEMMGKGDKAQHNGVFVLTNRRACFYRKGMFGEVFETIPINKISSVETKSMMGHRILNLHTSHDGMKFKTFEDKVLFDKTHERLEVLRDADAKPPIARESVSAANPIEQLKKLGELRDAGIVTQSEFDAKKSELLARL